MLHPYTHVMLHKNEHLERVKLVEHQRLVQLVSRRPRIFRSQLRFWDFISNWWTNRLQLAKEERLGKRKIVMPEA